MSDEMKLLREYATSGSQQAFAEIARRYVDAVYASARRQVRDEHLAEDVTQAVFIVLAQKARSVDPNHSLLGWLLKTTRYCAANARRAREHREIYERKAGEMANQSDAQRRDQADWQELSPLLDEGLNKLRAKDRDAVLMKFFEKKTLRQVGEAMGISEEAAGKRVNRAIDKLRAFFARRGAVVSATALVAALTTESAHAAPAALAGAITTSGATAASSSASAMAKGAMILMATEKTKAAMLVAAVLALGVGGGAVIIRNATAAPKQRTVNIATRPATLPSGAGVTFSDGTTVQVVGIGEVPAAPAGSWLGELMGAPAPPPGVVANWWGADGLPVPAPASLRQLGQVSAGDPLGRRQIRFIFAVRGPAAAGGNVSVRIDGVTSNAMSSRNTNGETLMNYAGSVSADIDNAAVRLGLSKGAWQEDASMTLSAAAPTTRSTGAPVFGAINEEEGKSLVDVYQNRAPRGDRDRRFIVIRTDGKTVWPTESRGYPTGVSVISFPCRKSAIAKIVCQSRDYEWATMNVALKPAKVPTTRVAAGK